MVWVLRDLGRRRAKDTPPALSSRAATPQATQRQVAHHRLWGSCIRIGDSAKPLRARSHTLVTSGPLVRSGSPTTRRVRRRGQLRGRGLPGLRRSSHMHMA